MGIWHSWCSQEHQRTHRLSSSTEFRLSIHSGSISPSHTTHECTWTRVEDQCNLRQHTHAHGTHIHMHAQHTRTYTCTHNTHAHDHGLLSSMIVHTHAHMYTRRQQGHMQQGAHPTCRISFTTCRALEVKTPSVHSLHIRRCQLRVSLHSGERA